MNSYNFYIKKLNKQELGYRKGIPGKAGRYIYVSKKATEFFPYLSRQVTNDSVLLPLVLPGFGRKAYCRYVYHNDKFTKDTGTRDEYRIYLNSDVDPGSCFFKADDIVVLEQRGTNHIDRVYILYHFRSDSSNYSELNALLKKNKIDNYGNHALCNDIPMLQGGSLIESEEFPVYFADDVIDAIREEQREFEHSVEEVKEGQGSHLFNSVSFREFVLFAYGYRCAITGEVIQYKGLNNLEAAHIKPKAHNGTFLPSNGLALSRDMHWAFDKGMITISETYQVQVHELVRKGSIGCYHNKEIFMPSDEYFQPNIEFIRYHQNNIFGLFLRSGGIRGV